MHYRLSNLSCVLINLGLAAAAIVQIVRFEPTVRSVQADNQIYFYIAERVAAGVAPHVSLVDHKHQLSALLSGAAISTGRMWGADDVMSSRLLSAVIAVLTVLLIFQLGLSVSGSLVAGLFAAVAFLGFRSLFLEAAIGF